MLVNIHVGGQLYGVRRKWSAVPRIGEDVWVEHVSYSGREEDHMGCGLKVIAVVWHKDHVDVNLQEPKP